MEGEGGYLVHQECESIHRLAELSFKQQCALFHTEDPSPSSLIGPICMTFMSDPPVSSLTDCNSICAGRDALNLFLSCARSVRLEEGKGCEGE